MRRHSAFQDMGIHHSFDITGKLIKKHLSVFVFILDEVALRKRVFNTIPPAPYLIPSRAFYIIAEDFFPGVKFTCLRLVKHL
jgi:hypothetical protein